jgi:hypothetical protein
MERAGRGTAAGPATTAARSAWGRGARTPPPSIVGSLRGGRLLAGLALVAALVGGAAFVGGARAPSPPILPAPPAPAGAAAGSALQAVGPSAPPAGPADPAGEREPSGEGAPRWLLAALGPAAARTCSVEGRAAVCEPLGDGPDELVVERAGRRLRRLVAGRLGAGLPVTSGPASCPGGNAEHRTWSWPAAPHAAAGRYGCHPGPPAVLWWTDDATGIAARAVAHDGDLARLFAWWSALGDHG